MNLCCVNQDQLSSIFGKGENQALKQFADKMINVNGNNESKGLSSGDVVLDLSLEARQIQVSTMLQKGSEEKVMTFFKSESFTLDISIAFDRPASDKAKAKETEYSKESEKLDAMLGEWSSEKVSDRVSEFAKAVYESLLAKQGGDENPEKLEKFRDLIMNAIDLGFTQAKEEAGEVEDVVSELQHKTYDLIQNKLGKYFEERLAGLSGKNSDQPVTDQSMNIHLEYSKVEYTEIIER